MHVSPKVASKWAMGISNNLDHYGYEDDHRAELVNAAIIAAMHYVLLNSNMVTPRQMIGAIIDYEAGDADIQGVINAGTLMVENLSHMNTEALARLSEALNAVT